MTKKQINLSPVNHKLKYYAAVKNEGIINLHGVTILNF